MFWGVPSPSRDPGRIAGTSMAFLARSVRRRDVEGFTVPHGSTYGR